MTEEKIKQEVLEEINRIKIESGKYPKKYSLKLGFVKDKLIDLTIKKCKEEFEKEKRELNWQIQSHAVLCQNCKLKYAQYCNNCLTDAIDVKLKEEHQKIIGIINQKLIDIWKEVLKKVNDNNENIDRIQGLEAIIIVLNQLLDEFGDEK